jgi:hypothetical protein
MSYDDIFEAAGILSLLPSRGRFTWADMRQLVDHFYDEWIPKKDVQKEIDYNHKDFEITRQLVLGGFIIRQVHYPNCPQSIKIMVHKEPVDLLAKLNPHFGEHNSPVARFEPTEEGWAMAIQFASTYVT